MYGVDRLGVPQTLCFSILVRFRRHDGYNTLFKEYSLR